MILARRQVHHFFIAGKFAPVPALVAELINGQTMVGEDVTLSNEVFSNTIPL